MENVVTTKREYKIISSAEMADLGTSFLIMWLKRPWGNK
jgi:hypothetical protein